MPPDPIAPAAEFTLRSGSLVARFGFTSPFRRGLLFYAFTAALCLGCLALVLHLRDFNPLYPYSYSGDSLLHVVVIKAIVEHGWYEFIDRLSAPIGLHLEDFPLADNLCCAVIRVMALGTSNPFLIQNLFFLGLFPVTAVVTAWTLRRFGVSAGGAFLGGMLYALLPYHFLRGTWHLFLTAYLLVPPLCLVAWWTMQGMIFASRDSAEEPTRTRVRRWRLGGSIVICALMGCNAVYYPFFACAMLGVAGLYALAARRDWRHGALAWTLAALIGAIVVANLWPTISYVRKHGKVDVGVRTPGEAEVYGLKIAQLLLPIASHRSSALAALRQKYADSAPLHNENDGSSLGMIGSCGLLLLLGWVLMIRPKPDSPPGLPDHPPSLAAVLTPISVLNLGAILFGTIGGFSSLFALLVSSQVRSYNRISVFIAFFALLAVVAVLDQLIGRRLQSPAGRAAFFVGLVALTVFGVWDQTTPRNVQDYHQARHACIDDARYFARIEKALPPGTMIFQLPAMSFPESGGVNEMGDYAHVRGYMQTAALRWSYGAMKERGQDTWNATTADFPPDKMLPILAAAGFGGVYIDGSGYQDHGKSEIEGISEALGGTAPILSKNRLTAFFDLAPHNAALLKNMSNARRAALLHALRFKWAAQFSGPEKNASERWVWCGQRGDLVLNNDSDKQIKTVRVSMDCRAATNGTYHMHVSGDVVHRELEFEEDGGPFAATFAVPPGQHVVHFECDAPEVHSPGDPRPLAWQAHDPVVEDVTGE